MDHYPLSWGRPRPQTADLFSAASAIGSYRPHDWDRQAFGQSSSSCSSSSHGPVGHTQSPIVTGTSVLALKFKDGVMLAADNLASYGSLARFKDVERLKAVGERTVVGAGGDMSDFQQLERTLEALVIEESNASDGHSLGPSEVYNYLSKLMYARRTKMNPLWNTLVVGGLARDGKPFLGYVDLQGTTYTASTLATGYGAYIAQPLLRKAVEGHEHELTREQGAAILRECMKVLFYRDARSINKFQIATVTAEGVDVGPSERAETHWAFAEGLRGYGNSSETV